MSRIFAAIAALTITLPALGALESNTEYPVKGEEKIHKDFADFINGLQKKIDAKDPKRGFHNKHHACLYGELDVVAGRNAETKYGMFKNTRSYPVEVRFSNGSFRKSKDILPDMRGVAIKAYDVDGDRLVKDGAKTQDFLFINVNPLFGKNTAEFRAFLETALKGPLALGAWLLKHPDFATAISLPVHSLLLEHYWSNAVIALGKGDAVNKAKHAVKTKIAPCNPRGKEFDQYGIPVLPPDDYLGGDLIEHAKNHEICFGFYVMFQDDPNKPAVKDIAEKNPIEDMSVKWTGTYYKVAELKLPKQTFDPKNAKQVAHCEGLNFSPWDGIEDHRPMGDIQRSRKPAYAQSQLVRHKGKVPPQPDKPTTKF